MASTNRDGYGHCKDGPLVVSYGAGLNSTSMLIGFVRYEIPVDLILFADTGGEKPETYEFLEYFSDWLVGSGWPEIIKVKNDGMYSSLEDNCLTKNMLPSLAYGFKSCSDKYKIRPQNKYVKYWAPAMEQWAKGGKVLKAIGYDAGEERRATKESDDLYSYWYPLIQWGWGREECLEAVKDAGLKQPPKSSCFFCPAMKKHEIFELQQNNPDLLQRALAMEDRALPTLTDMKGLGRSFSWRELIEKKSLPLVDTLVPEIPCDCYDQPE